MINRTETGSLPHNRSIIVQVGAEGGGLTLLGQKTAEGWHFELAIIDQSSAIIDEGTEISASEGNASTWRGGLRLLDQYPWAKLYPLAVHPDFADQVWQAVKRRLGDEGEKYDRFNRWQRVCYPSPSDAQY